MKTFQKSFALFLAFAIMLTISPIKSNAKWRDQSSNLPGFATDEDKQLVVILGVAAGVVVVGTLTYYFIHKHKMQKAITQTGEYINNLKASAWEKELNKPGEKKGSITSTTELFNTSNISLNPESSLLQKIETSSRSLPVDLIFAPVSSSHNLALGNTNGVQIGLRIRF